MRLLWQICLWGLVSVALAPAADFPVQRVLLFNNGAGLISRQALVEGSPSIRFMVQPERLDDLLKTVRFFDSSGGTLAALRWPHVSPSNRLTRSFLFDMKDEDQLVRALLALRGAQVRITAGQTFTGRIVSLQLPAGQQHPAEKSPLLTLLSDDGVLQNQPLAGITEITMMELSLQKKLEQFFTLKAEKFITDQEPVTLDLQGAGVRPVELDYLTALPPWKATYRLQQTGDGWQLTGYACAHNTTGENWSGVELEFLAGQPYDFLYHLATPAKEMPPDEAVTQAVKSTLRQRPARASRGQFEIAVKDCTGGVIPGVTIICTGENNQLFRGLTGDDGTVSIPASPGVYRIKAELEGFHPYTMSVVPLAEGFDTALTIVLTAGEISNCVEVRAAAEPWVNGISPAAFQQAIRQQAGGLTTYRIPRKVDLPEGQSVLIPFFSDKIEGEPALFIPVRHYGGETLLPVLRAYRLTNSTPSTLEEGLCAIYHQRSFAGQSWVPRLAPGQPGILKYGRETAITAKLTVSSQPGPVLKVETWEGRLFLTRQYEKALHFVLENKTGQEHPLLLKIEKGLTGEQLVAPAKALEETPEYYLLRGLVKADGPTGIIIKVTGEDLGQLEWEMVDAPLLEAIRKASLLPEEKVRIIAQKVDRLKARELYAARLKTMDEQQRRLEKSQEHVRKNLEVLGVSDEEKLLQNRYASLLARDEERLSQLRQEEGQARKLLNQVEDELRILDQKISSWTGAG